MTFYTVSEAAKKLDLNDETVRILCERGIFQNAYKNENGNWIIPEDYFITTKEQDDKAEEILRYIDKKNQGIDNNVIM